MDRKLKFSEAKHDLAKRERLNDFQRHEIKPYVTPLDMRESLRRAEVIKVLPSRMI